ncbi:hypothetical protein SCA6_004172 [Theobroma cacao]
MVKRKSRDVKERIRGKWRTGVSINVIIGNKGNFQEPTSQPNTTHLHRSFTIYRFQTRSSPPTDLNSYHHLHHFSLPTQRQQCCRFSILLLKELMGGVTSKRSATAQSSSVGSNSHSWDHQRYAQPSYAPSSRDYSWDHQRYAQPSYAPSSRDYVPQQHYAPPLQSYGGRAPESNRRLERKYSKIDDNYNSLEQVTEALARAGLESSNLIVGIDFTKSNEWTGARSFHRRSLHHIGDEQNPYEQAISIIGKTLSSFDEDNLIPCFGFGDASTHDQEVFSFYPDETFCNGFEEVLRRYRELVPNLRLAGPTSFAPIIEMAITIVEQSGGQYHVLLIIADGQNQEPNGRYMVQELKN